MGSKNPTFSISARRVVFPETVINDRISAVWSTTMPFASFSYTPRVQEVHTKAEVVHLTPCLLRLGVLFNCHG